MGALVILGPFLLSFSTALKTPQQFATSSPLSLPAPFTFENFARLFGAEHNFVSPIAVTVQMTLVILVVQLGCSILAAYAFARLQFWGRDVIFWAYLATMMIPAVTTIVPLYGMLTSAGLRNTFWALVLPTLFGSPYAIFLLREYFRAVPDDLEAAARIDGCGTLRVLWYVVLPHSRPIIATLTVITVVTQWNNFLWPRVITTGDDWAVLTVATAALQSQYNGNWTLVMAATTIALLPLLLIYLLFQRRIVDSIAIGGFK
ncbi:carbohydrate ABC transporter permease [Microlunatus elymi]|uniref:Carbohydrate ABC transporter permease n=2 Tax=Microlunatus elymi TaxID=2596828 RepID=A0A516Q663_9ACTN|nr:carbohydrate ABC transporter permease [Microlunatus elymi]